METIINTRINGFDISNFGASLLSYEIGPSGYEKGYFKPPARMIPVKLATNVGLRTIKLTLDFEGSSRRDIAVAISRVIALLRQETSLLLPDGFHYWCEYKSSTAPQEMAPWISQVTIELEGFRHEPLVTQQFTSPGTIFVGGNCKTPAVVKITPSGPTVTFNGITISRRSQGNELPNSGDESPVPGDGSEFEFWYDGPSGDDDVNTVAQSVYRQITIDGIYTTITDAEGENIYGQTDMTEWPSLEPGVNEITFTGASLVEISYYPIWQ